MDSERIIVALDFSSKSEVKDFLAKFDLNDISSPKFVKVGMELYYAEGPEILSYLKNLGLKIFLDLKLHDIPNTVYGSIKSLAKYEIDILNVHASGGIEMMQRAKAGLFEINPQAKLIAVTQLTSTDQEMLNQELNITGSVEDAVLHLAHNAKAAGLDGIVCSPLEVNKIKNAIGPNFITVCPGVRLESGDSHDQKRITTPEQAFKNGADYIVMGRAITQADDPTRVLSSIIDLQAVI